MLSINALADSYTYPHDILDNFFRGEWTASVKGKPYHNLALDEAHESIINRRLKQITTRPSCFRMVELSDFMAYLDGTLCGLDSYVLEYHQKKDYDKKNSCAIRASLVFNVVVSVPRISPCVCKMCF